MSRCYNPNNCRYARYGGAGVTVCEEWRDSPKAFIEWALANGWKEGLQLDKDILSEKLGIKPYYGPETCMFVTHAVNTRQSTSRKTAYGKNKRIKVSQETANEIRTKYQTGSYSQRKLAQEYGVSQNTICRIVNTN